MREPAPGVGGQPPLAQEPRRWGSLPGGIGVGIVTGGAALGAITTVLTGRQPGSLLGVFLIAGAVAGALAVRAQAAYLIIPVPALAYLVAATAAGLIHDHAAGSSRAILAVSEVQWFAAGFITVTVATVLAIAVAAYRWQRRRRGGPGPA